MYILQVTIEKRKGYAFIFYIIHFYITLYAFFLCFFFSVEKKIYSFFVVLFIYNVLVDKVLSFTLVNQAFTRAQWERIVVLTI